MGARPSTEEEDHLPPAGAPIPKGAPAPPKGGRVGAEEEHDQHPPSLTIANVRPQKKQKDGTARQKKPLASITEGDMEDMQDPSVLHLSYDVIQAFALEEDYGEEAATGAGDEEHTPDDHSRDDPHAISDTTCNQQGLTWGSRSPASSSAAPSSSTGAGECCGGATTTGTTTTGSCCGGGSTSSSSSSCAPLLPRLGENAQNVDSNVDSLASEKNIAWEEKALRPGRGQKVWLRTFGCSHNISDSELMAGLLEAEGYTLVSEESDAEVFIVNSCTVKNPSQDAAVNLVGTFFVFNTKPDRIGTCTQGSCTWSGTTSSHQPRCFYSIADTRLYKLYRRPATATFWSVWLRTSYTISSHIVEGRGHQYSDESPRLCKFLVARPSR